MFGGGLPSQSFTALLRVMEGKVAIVTGANAGVGRETALALASVHRLHVILACRSQTNGDEAASYICAQYPAAQVTVMLLDLASLDSVLAFAARVTDEIGSVSLLVNNAGIGGMNSTPQRTPDETEPGDLHYRVNFVGHFLLTLCLLEPLAKGAPSRVVNLSSVMHRQGRVDWRAPLAFSPSQRTYATSKVCHHLLLHPMSLAT